MSEILKIQKLYSEKKNSEDFIKNTISKAKENKNLNAYISIVEKYNANKKNEKSLLNNIPYVIKDNINVFNTITTGGSLFFEKFKSPYNATVVDLLNDAGAILIAKGNLDEFGMGGDGIYSGYGDVINPFDSKKITGGSSSGPAVMVAKKIVPFSIGTDTGDSVRKPASYLGIIGFKPTYGLISRYGVFPYSPSFDHVGVLTNCFIDLCIVLDCIVKHDEKDFTSQINYDFSFYENINNKINKKIKLAIFKDALSFADEKIKNNFDEFVKSISNEFEISFIDFNLSLLKLIPSVYKILSYSEAMSCYQNLTGIPFGEKSNIQNYQEKIIDIRTKKLGYEVKKRLVFGAYSTLQENYYNFFLKSKKIRKLIVDRTNEIFSKHDFVLMPSSSCFAPLVKDVKEKKFKSNPCDDFLQIANFGGFPSITFPWLKKDNLFLGLNLFGKSNDDLNLLIIANQLFKTIEGRK